MTPAKADLATLFHTLGCETRLEIIRILLARGSQCVSDLEPLFEVTQSSISNELRILVDRNIVAYRYEVGDRRIRHYYLCEPVRIGLLLEVAQR